MLFPYIVMKLMEIASLIVFLAFFYGGLCIKIATFPEGKDDTSGSTTCSCSTGDIITGAVLSVACEGSIFPKVKEEMKHSNVCTEEFRWHIPSGWCSPVDLLFNLTVPMIRKPRARRITEVELNLTRGGWQIAKVRWDENLLNEENMRYVTKNCTFVATIQFNGSKTSEDENKGLKETRQECNTEMQKDSAGHHGICLIKGEYRQSLCRYRQEHKTK
uniref:DA-P36 family member n=1 Tax=Rhipicephalus zambeziensis TaxID=60191 RepID=A0A224Y359_9ACAR